MQLPYKACCRAMVTDLFGLHGQIHCTVGEVRCWQYRDIFCIKHYCHVKATYYLKLYAHSLQALGPGGVVVEVIG